MTLQDIKKTKRYRRRDAQTHGQRENSIPHRKQSLRGVNKTLRTDGHTHRRTHGQPENSLPHHKQSLRGV